MKVVLFDFDGTIANSVDLLLDIITKISAERGYKVLNYQQYTQLKNYPIRELLSCLEIPADQLPVFLKETFQQFNIQISNVQLFDNIKPALLRLNNSGCKLGILTTNQRNNVKTFLKKNSLEIFDYLVTDTPLFEKDQLLIKFIQEHSLKLYDVVYVGDEIRDIEAAKKAGIQSVAVTWGYNTEESLARYHPNYLFTKPMELIKLVV